MFLFPRDIYCSSLLSVSFTACNGCWGRRRKGVTGRTALSLPSIKELDSNSNCQLLQSLHLLEPSMNGDHHISLTFCLLIFKGGSHGTTFSRLVKSLFLRRPRATSRSDTLLLFLLLALRWLCPGRSQDGERMRWEFVLCFFPDALLFFSLSSYFICLCWDRVLLYCQAWPQNRGPPASASWILDVAIHMATVS